METIEHRQVVHLGEESLTKVPSILEELSVKRVFFCVDENAYHHSRAERILGPLLNTTHHVVFSEFEPNPKLEDVQAGIKKFREADPDIVIALGGGTAIDLAKMIAVLADSSDDIRDVILGTASVVSRSTPLLVIPTTSGTGSEATHFAVVYIDGVKYSLADSALLPDFAIIDPILTSNLPAKITAATGLDAFCQAIESIWAVGSNDESLEYATAAVRLCSKHLLPAIHSPSIESRLGMCQAAHLAGKAINISKTTLPHALSYAITSAYKIPHGAAVALTLPAALKFNSEISDADCNDPRGVAHVAARMDRIQNLFDASDIEETGSAIRHIIAATGNAASPREIGITDAFELDWLAEQVNPQRLANNPRSGTHEELVRLLRQ
ncbi:phosphonoacetaldehyde reductase [Thalassoroseus pseudoceratinae]|uniref:phosphonoacetaldehyde reductase n=1 Tax=Thalassoroseus pseudoceratinae TaxID=2713176 RepID=UPI00141D81B3|nr:phosphonoacetaldehyde reductase [Thalassoroseus pseudoceratinae]